MRIEILIPGENLVFHPITSSKLVIGSGEDCDVVISHPEVSRRHLTILSDEEQFFVLDSGSTNGSYLNEEKLIPGRRVEFNSFFPIRLGKDVLISLLSDEDEIGEAHKIQIPVKSNQPRHPAQDESTRVISLKDLKSSSTSKLVKNRKEIIKKTSKTVASGKKSKFKAVHLMVVGILGAGIYLNNPFKKSIAVSVKEDVSRADEYGSSKTQPPSREVYSVDTSGIPASLAKDLASIKCKTPLAKTVCTSLGIETEGHWGVLENGRELLIYVNASRVFKKAHELLTPVVNGAPSLLTPVDEHDVSKAAAAIFVAEGFALPLPYDDLIDHDLKIGLYEVYSEKSRLRMVLQLKAVAHQNIKYLLTRQRIEAIRTQGTKVLSFVDEYYSSRFVDEDEVVLDSRR